METKGNSKMDDPRVLRDQVELSYQHYPKAQFGLSFATLILGIALWNVVDHGPLLAWVSAMVVFILLRWIHYWVFTKHFSHSVTRLAFWRNFFLAGVLTSGVLVATGIFVMFPGDSFPHQMLVGLIVLTLISGASVSYGTIVWASTLFIVPPLIALAFQFYNHHPQIGWMFAIGLPVYGILMIGVALQSNRTIIRTLELARRNEDLADELKVSEEKFRGLVENATDSIVLIQGENIVYANKAAEQLSGYEKEALLKMPIAALMAETPRGRERMYGAYQQRIAGEEVPHQYEAQAKRKGGEVLDVLVSSSLIHFPEGVGVIAMLKDITELKRAERMKSELVTLVSHELRTPVTVVQSSLEALASDLEGSLSKEGREIFDVARNNTNRLVHLVQDILDLEKLNSIRMGYRMRTQRAQTLIEQVANEHRPLAESSGLTLIVRPERVPLTIWCDYDRINQVLSNLLTNAIKFSKSGGEITIEASPGDGWVRLSVSNQGPGVPEAFRDRIFLPFSQSDSERANPNRGTGLGLSISKTIVEDHNGYIGFDSTPDATTTFYFLLPEHQSIPS